MRTSQNGIDLIKRWEGCRLQAYLCQAGVPTIGYGHTAGVRMGQKITQAQAESFLKDDLVKFERNVMKYDGRYHWSQNQFDALVSFAFNIGSIDQLTANGTRGIAEIAAKMPQYARAGGKILPGLRTRREQERALFQKPAQQGEACQAAQAASAGQDPDAPGHVQLNYRQGETYQTAVDGLRIRTKRAQQDPIVLPNGDIIGMVDSGKKIKNLATARVGDQIWMYIGLDAKGREQWLCADNGQKAYIE